MQISRSDGVVTLKLSLFAVLLPTMSLLLLCLQLLYVLVQSIKPLFPDLPVALGPIGHFFQGTGIDSTASPLRVPPLHDQSRAFQHTKVLRDGGHTHFKRLGELANRAFAHKQTGQDGSASRVRKRCKRGVQSIAQ